MTAQISATSGEQQLPEPAQPQVRSLPPRPQPDRGPVPLPEVPGDGIICFDTSVTEEEKWSVLFRIRNAEGKVTEYKVWDNPPASVGLQYLDETRRIGPNLSLAWLMEEMLGAESFAALKECKAVDKDGLQRVAEVCIEKVMATLGQEPPKEQG